MIFRTKLRISAVLFTTTLLFVLLGFSQSSPAFSASNVSVIKNMIMQGYEKAYIGNQIIGEIEERLIPIREKIRSLNEQISLLNEEYKLTQKKIQDVEKQIAIKKKEIEILQKESEKNEDEYMKNRSMLVDLGKMLYQNQQKYVEFDGGERRVNIIKLLLSSSIVSEISKNNEYLKLAGDLGKKVMQETETLSEGKKLILSMLTEKQKKLTDLEHRLDVQKRILATQKQAKEALIAFTKGSEDAYQELLSLARAEQEQILEDIKASQSKLAQIEIILNKSGEPEARKISSAVFDWPVDPSQGVSATFKDEGYEEKFGIVHNAIDIRIAEGTEVKAPMDGYVFKIHDGGRGYSYLILAHRNNMLTVYGHLMEFSVKEGDIVKNGATLGLSGGNPGSPGAGYLTTGPHLHFEVFDNGKHVDPLSVLDLTRIPKDRLPKGYF